jgi:hypothetical protein
MSFLELPTPYRDDFTDIGMNFRLKDRVNAGFISEYLLDYGRAAIQNVIATFENSSQVLWNKRCHRYRSSLCCE